MGAVVAGGTEVAWGADVAAGAGDGVAAAWQAARTSTTGISMLIHPTGFLNNEGFDL
jgi:hypothetical protein